MLSHAEPGYEQHDGAAGVPVCYGGIGLDDLRGSPPTQPTL